MSATEASLLFRLRTEASGVQSGVDQAKAAVAQLRASVATDTSHMQSASKTALEDIGNNLNVFIGQRIPLLGGSFLRVTEHLHGLKSDASATSPAITQLGQSIEGLASSSGKTTKEVASFLNTYSKIKDQSQANAAAIQFFGKTTDAFSGEVQSKLAPELASATQQLQTLAAGTEEAGGGFAAMVNPVTVAAVAILAIVGAGIAATATLYEIAKASSETTGKLYDLSQQTGLSVETLSALTVLSATTGGSIETVAASVGIFQRKLEEAQDPGTKTARIFRQLGVDTKDTQTALEQSLGALAKMPEGFHQTASALELFGRGGKGMLAILKEMDGDLGATTAKLREMGLIISTEDAKAADVFNDQLAIIGFQVRGLAGQITREVLPSILAGVKGLSDFIVANRVTIVETVLAVTKALTGAALAAGVLGIALIAVHTSAIPSLLTGLTSLVSSVRLLGQVMIGTASLIQGAAATTIAATAGWAALAVVIGLVVYAIARQDDATEASDKITLAHIATQRKAIEQSDALVKQALALGPPTQDSVEWHKRLDEVIQHLAPTEQAYIRALKDEGDQHKETIRLSKDAAVSQTEKAKNDLRLLVDGIIQRQEELAKLHAQIEESTILIRKINEGVSKGDDPVTIDASGNLVELSDVSKAYNKQTEEIEKHIKALNSDGLALSAQAAALGLDAAGLEKFMLASGKSREQVDLLVGAFKASAAASDQVVVAVKSQITTLEQLNAEIKRLGQTETDVAEQRVASAKIDEEQAKQDAANRTAAAENQYQLGRTTAATVLATRQQSARDLTKATKTEIQAQIDLEYERIKAISENDVDRVIKLKASQEKIAALQQGLKDKDSALQRDLRNLQVAAQVEAEKAEQEHQQKLLDITLSGNAARIRAIQFQVTIGKTSAQDAEKEQEQIENDGFAARKKRLEDELSRQTDPIKRQAISDALQKLEGERTDNLELQSERRTEIERKGSENVIAIQLLTAETIVKIGQVSDAETITSVQAMAAARVLSEEDAAQRITKIRLDALDRDRDLIKARLTAADANPDELARTKEKASLNLQLKVIERQRTQIETDGNRSREDGRKADIENERKYAEDLLAIKEHTTEFERTLAQLAIDHLVVTHAKRAKIIAAELDLALSELNDRHAKESAAIKLEQQNNNERVNALTRFIATLKKAGKEQSDEYKKAVAELAAANAKTVALDKQAEAEQKAHDARVKAERDKARRDAAAATNLFIDPKFLPDIAEGATKAQAAVEGLKAAMSQLGEIGVGVFKSFAEGVGSMVENYVLLGETGPAALRKLAAQALASLAAQAAVQAIYWTAQGIVDLFFNPARAAADFAGAALFASIAGVSAIAGRALAGDLFKPKTATGTGAGSSGGSGSGGSGSSGGGSGKTQIYDLGRNIIVEHIVTIRAQPGFIADQTVKALDSNHPQLTRSIKNAASRG